MDPNLPQTPDPQKPFGKRNIIIITIIIVILTTAAALIIYFPNLFKKEPVVPVQNKVQTPTPSPSSKISAPQIYTSRGIITSLTSLSLTIKVDGESQTYSLADTKDFQKLVSGTLAGGDAKTIPVSLTDLKTGQEVKIVTKRESTNSAVAVLIIK